MNTLIAVAIAPVGVGDELSAHVAEVVKVIRESGLPNKTSSMFTEIEGDWDAVMDVVKRATFVLAEKGIRTEVVLKADIRPGFTSMIDGKIDRLNNALNAQVQSVNKQVQSVDEQVQPVDEQVQSVDEQTKSETQAQPVDIQARVFSAMERIRGLK